MDKRKNNGGAREGAGRPKKNIKDRKIYKRKRKKRRRFFEYKKRNVKRL